MDHTVTVRPLEVDITASEDDSLLDSLLNANIEVESICGGIGVCGKCRIRVLEGNTSDPTSEEEDHLSGEMFDAGERLACQTYPLSDLVIHIPAASRPSDLKLQLPSELPASGEDPAVQAIDLNAETASLTATSNLAEALEAVRSAGAPVDRYDEQAMPPVPFPTGSEGEEIRAIVRDGELLALTSTERNPLGVAIDLGSSKIALFLYDLRDRIMFGSRAFLNPQIPYGEDIISRLRFALENVEGAEKLKDIVTSDLNEKLSELMLNIEKAAEDVYEMVVVGNTAMHHLFLGLPLKQLAMSPYLPATQLPIEIKARDLGLAMNHAGVVYMPPPIAGFVGSDHLAALSAARLWERPGPCLLLDIGTNTEVSLQVDGRISCCSCASGPAFEGGSISQGMRAGTGAIERVAFKPATGRLELSVIGGGPPLGICGSGILTAIASMLAAGVIDVSGKLAQALPGVKNLDGESCFYLSPPGESTRQGVAISQSDIREIQKAKGAIRAGMDILLKEAGIDYGDLRELMLAGAFGSYLDPASAVSIALLPPVPISRINQVGNAAGAGARQMLLSNSLRREAERLAGLVHNVELSGYSGFDLIFAADMFLDERKVEEHKQHFNLTQ